jgi:hypothetical protein
MRLASRIGAGRRTPWPRVALDWRRRPRLAPAQRFRPAAPIAASIARPPFHLHLSVHVTFGARGPALSTLTRRSTITNRRWEKIATERVVSAGALATMPGARIWQASVPSRTESHAVQLVTRSSRSLDLVRRSERHVEKTTLYRMVRSIPRIKESVTADKWPPTAPSRAASVTKMFATVGARGVRRSTVATRRDGSTAPAQLFSATPELRWPARGVEGATAADATPHAAIPFTPARTSATRGAAAQEPAGAPERGRQSPAALDTAAVDRLAEDVIRRVERHVRIERERRGV